MIGVPTTFVVGAGACAAAGLPPGPELKRLAMNLIRGHPVFDSIVLAGVSSAKLDEFVDALTRAEHPSIDQFLEVQPGDKYRVEGRAVIAALLGYAIAAPKCLPTLRKDPDDDWLTDVLQWMREGTKSPQEFAATNRVTFVTFNYDRLIENGIRKFILSRFPADHSGHQDAIDSIPVIHVHGTLPTTTPTMHIQEDEKSPDLDPNWLSSAAGSIHVVNDEVPTPVKTKAIDAARKCRLLCFLGFSFIEANLQTLGVRPSVTRKLQVYGSAYGLKVRTKREIETLFHGGITLGDENHKCKQFIDSHHVLRTKDNRLNEPGLFRPRGASNLRKRGLRENR